MGLFVGPRAYQSLSRRDTLRDPIRVSSGAVPNRPNVWVMKGIPMIEKRLEALGIALPKPPKPVASYVPCVRTGDLLIVAGQVPIADGSLRATGTVPDQVSPDEAYACAKLCAINALAAAKAELGSLDRIRRVVRLGAFVACGADFTEHPSIANGASDFMHEVFGEAGKHARAAVGCASLPLGAPVEIEFTFEVA